MPEPKFPHREPVRRLPDLPSDQIPFIPQHPPEQPQPGSEQQIPLYPPGQEPRFPYPNDEDDNEDDDTAEKRKDRPEVGEIPDKDEQTEISEHPQWEYTDGGTMEIVERDRRPGESKEEYLDRKRYEPKGGSAEINSNNVDFNI